MNVCIIDDEPGIRNTLIHLIRQNYHDMHIVSSGGSVKEGYELIIKHSPDLLLLDIELPDGNGFELIKMIPHVSFRIIFITGHQEYALAAFRVSAIDYILKPFDEKELCDALDKARNLINREEQQLKLQALEENLEGRKKLKRIILPTADNLHLVAISEIIRAEADSNYTVFRLTENRRIMVSRTIKEYDALLSGAGMIRVHQSHLVNISFIEKFVKKGGGHLLMKDGSTIPVSPGLKKKMLNAIKEHLYE